MKNVISFDIINPKFIKLQERAKHFYQAENNLICIKLVGVNQHEKIKAIRTKHKELKRERNKLVYKSIILNNTLKKRGD